MPAGDALAAFLRALGVPGQDIPAETDERAARYRSLLAGRRMLIVLDNARSAEQVRPLLPVPACVTLVTSRDALPGLVARDGAIRLDLELLPMAEALSLLRALIGDRVDAARGAATALATQCCRLPLALRVAAELAAARPAAPLTDLVSELADHRQRLDRLDAGGDSRSAVRAVFSWSYRHLDADAARLFRLAALHPGPDLDSNAAAALTGTPTGETNRILDLLARAHLIQATEPDRYAMHDLLRAYARDLADTRDGQDAVKTALTRLFDYYLRTAATAMDQLLPAEQNRRPPVPASFSGLSIADPAEARAWLDTQRDRLVAATAHAAAHGWPGHATRLAETLAGYLYTEGHYAEAITIHTYARGAARDAGDQAAESAALTNLGLAHAGQDRRRQAAECFRQAIDRSREAADQLGETRALGNLALMEWLQGLYQQADAHIQQVLSLCRQIGDRFGEARALGNLGGIAWRQGRYREAVSYQRRCLRLCRQIGDQLGEAQARSRLGLVSLRLGRYQQAEGYFQQALDLRRKTGDRAGEAEALHHLGAVSWRRGRRPQAMGYFEQALGLFRDLGDHGGEARTQGSLGGVEWWQGRRDQARNQFRQALRLCREIGDRYGEAEILNTFGEALLAAGRPAQARAQHAAALDLAVQIGDRYEQARAHDGIGRACRAAGDSSQARRHWDEALALFAFLGTPEATRIRAQLTTENR